MHAGYVLIFAFCKWRFLLIMGLSVIYVLVFAMCWTCVLWLVVFVFCVFKMCDDKPAFCRK